MREICAFLAATLLLCSCAANVRFIPTDESYVASPKAKDADIVFRRDKIARTHRVIGVIQAELGKRARRPELDALLIRKAREIGADGVMLVEYDVDRTVYVERHHAIVGRGPYRRHVVRQRPRVITQKSATGIAVVFD